MKRSTRSPAIFFLLFALVAIFPVSVAAQTGPVTVGRVFYVEGDLLRYVPEDSDWVAVVRDAPFGTEDTLYSGSQGMAELIVPNGSWIRIGNNTQIEAITLERDLSEIDVASGVARFYNKGAGTLIRATSPFGYVLAEPNTVFDFYVGENSVEVVPVRGTVTFVHAGTDARYDVSAGSSSVLADQNQVSSGDGTVDADWDGWNRDRESFWAAKARAGGRSAQYLPPSLRDEGYVLDENGRWDRVFYDGGYRWFWRPTAVVAGWEPFTVGRWTVWYGDQTWVPAEPFGYITHHYGNWVYIRNYWYWAPPVVSATVGLPLLDIGFFWYPGRVSWIYSGGYVGWVPLAPREPYYCHHPWGGPRAIVVTDLTVTRISIAIGALAYRSHAILVNRDSFYRVNNYRNVRVTNITNTTIINNYRAAPVVDDRVITHYREIKQRYNFADVAVRQKPHNAVVEHIQRNQTAVREARTERPVVVQERVKSLPEGRINREARIAEPKAPNYLVPPDQVNRPKSEIRLQEREIKRRPEPVAPEKPGRIERPAPPAPRPQEARPERPAPVKPEQAAPERRQEAAPPRPERVAPPKPEPVAPEKPGRIERPAPPAPRPQEARPERPAPAKPGRETPKKPGEQEEPQGERGQERQR